jgi:23S rRNA pseudouridine955/2504/2580 synthase
MQHGGPKRCNIAAFSPSINELSLNSQSIKKNSVRRVEVSPDRDGQRIDNFLKTQLKGVPRAAIYRLIRTGQVRINGKRCKPDRKIAAGDEIRIPPVYTSENGVAIVSDAVKNQIQAAIIYEDSDYLVIDKPSGMAVHSGSGLPWGMIDVVRQQRPDEYLELAHRIDRETSGCVALARSGQALRHLSALFREGTVRKKYLCLLDGRLAEQRVEVDASLLKVIRGGEHFMETNEKGKEAHTVFRSLQKFSDCTYSEAELLTGRTHQIRVHAAHLGMPLAGESRYTRPELLKKWKQRGLKRLFLHSHQLVFDTPDGTTISCHASLPSELRTLLDRLEG